MRHDTVDVERALIMISKVLLDQKNRSVVCQTVYDFVSYFDEFIFGRPEMMTRTAIDKMVQNGPFRIDKTKGYGKRKSFVFTQQDFTESDRQECRFFLDLLSTWVARTEFEGTPENYCKTLQEEYGINIKDDVEKKKYDIWKSIPKKQRKVPNKYTREFHRLIRNSIIETDDRVLLNPYQMILTGIYNELRNIRVALFQQNNLLYQSNENSYKLAQNSWKITKTLTERTTK